MSQIEQMEAELRKLSQTEFRQIRAWLDDVIEDELEFTRNLNGLSSNPNGTWPKVELRACG